MKLKKYAIVCYILVLAMIVPLGSMAVTPKNEQFTAPDYTESWIIDEGASQLDIRVDYKESESLNIVVTDGRTGEVWESNPVFTKGDQATTTDEKQKILKSQLIVTYNYDPNGNAANLEDIGYMSSSTTESKFWSQIDCIAKDQVEITAYLSDGTTVPYDEAIPDGLKVVGYRVVYSLGDSKAALFPKFLTDAQMQAYKALVTGDEKTSTEKAQETFEKKYEKLSIASEEAKIQRSLKRITNEAEKKAKEADLRKALEELLLDYPILTEVDENGEPMVCWRIYSDSISTKYKISKMIEAWAAIGYTREMLELDYAVSGYEDNSGGTGIVIPVEYMIEGNSLRVTILTDEIEIPAELAITRIDLLPSFGAVDDTYTDTYAFVPDGSGAIIEFNAVDTRIVGYQVAVMNHQKDEALSRLNTTDIRDIPYYENTILPCYGVKRDNAAWFCVIEKGYELSNIGAYVSDNFTRYNYAYTSFFPCVLDEIYYSSGSTSGIKMFPKIECLVEKEIAEKKVDEATGETTKEIIVKTVVSDFAKLPQTDLEQRYVFLYDDKANYSGMAEYMRNYLINTYNLTKTAAEESIPFYTDIYGAIDKKVSFVGFPINVKYALTTFEQAGQIVSDIKSIAGIDNITLRYKGVANGGMVGRYSAKFKVQGVLGGKSDYLGFIDDMSALGIDVYPDVDITHVYQDRMFDGFSPNNDTVETLGKTESIMYDMNVSTGVKDSKNDVEYYHPRWMVSPRLYDEMFTKFFDSLDKFDNKKISFASLGNSLTADYNEDMIIDRTQSARVISEQLKKYSGEGYSIIVDKGFYNTLPYVDTVLDLPMTSSQFLVEAYEVPFVQMVLHGLVSYAGEPLNVNQDSQNMILKSLEYGANVYARFMYEEDAVLQNTYFVNLYSLHYTNWLDEAKHIYSEVNAVMAKLQDQFIVKHERLAINVYCSTYENGTKIIVNYGINDYESAEFGVTVSSNGYYVKEAN